MTTPSHCRRRPVVVALALTLLITGCQLIVPPLGQGDPIPDLQVTYSEAEPVNGTIDVSATITDFTPTQMSFVIPQTGIPTFDDFTAPYEWQLDTTLLADQQHNLYVIATDQTRWVFRQVTIDVENRPNVVMVLADDLDEVTTDYWAALTQTKALVADQGVTFDNAFATDPVCCPARATLLTGKYPHNTGVFDNTPPDGGLPALQATGGEADTVAVRLQNAGYNTALVGKYLAWYNTPSYIPPGWDEWFAFPGSNDFYDGYDYDVSHNGVVEHYGTTPADYQTDVLRDHALSLIDDFEITDADPFLLWVTPTAPHLPMPPAPRHAGHPWVSDPLPTGPNYDEVDVSDKPTWLRDGVSPVGPVLEGFFTSDHRNRMGTLLALDELVGALHAKLVANGEIDNTVFVFLSDNGYNLGAHRLPSKQVPYDESIRIPWVMSGPGIDPGTSSSNMVTHVDLTPTLLDLAGLDPSDLDGRSLAPLWTTPSPPWRTDTLVEFNGTYSPTATFDTLADVQAAITAGQPVLGPTYRAVRDQQYLYVEWYAGTPHEYELYDVVADPYQLDNLLVTEPGVHDTTAATLQARLDALKVCSAAACRD